MDFFKNGALWEAKSDILGFRKGDIVEYINGFLFNKEGLKKEVKSKKEVSRNFGFFGFSMTQVTENLHAVLENKYFWSIEDIKKLLGKNK
jgi:transketolase N-terminal domain/subunit